MPGEDGANGGVGTILIQLARQAGVRVIGVAAPRHHDALRLLGAEPVDYADLDTLVAQVRALAPAGVDAVFDNIGGATVRRSWGPAGPRRHPGQLRHRRSDQQQRSMERHFVALLARITWWNVLPNRRRATFCNVWGGSRVRPAHFRARLHDDLTAVLDLLADGVLTAQIAARLPLADVAEAMRLAEARAVPGKVVLTP